MYGQLVGQRVVLRRRMLGRDGRPSYADLLGELLEIGSGHLVVRRDDGSTVTVPEAAVHRLRPVPPSRTQVLTLETVAARGWPAPRTARLGDWLLRAGQGWTRRANSALVVGDPGMPVDAALGRVRTWYSEQGLVPRLAVPLPAMAVADHAADRQRWALDVDVAVLTATMVAAAPDPAVRLADTPDKGWAAVYQARTLPPVGKRILTAPDQVTFASILDGDIPVAIGRGVVVDGWLGVTAVEVVPLHRRGGLARRLVRALLAWGAGQAATRCYVQVEVDNAPALRLYAGLGFTHHHRYRTRAAA
jgi:N-acetylglutamate synthase